MVLDLFGPLRRPDGGYAKSARGSQGSVYQTFLAVACQEMVGLPPDGPEAIIDMVLSRRRADGGFAELDAIAQGGANPTAAGLGLLRMLGDLEEPVRTAAVEFLAAMQTAEGGLRRTGGCPWPTC